MTYNPDNYHRRSIRLKGYNYSQAGAYFVTICTQGREMVLGDIVDAQTRASDVGDLVAEIWDSLPTWFLGLDLDAFVIMPNHIHGIILLGIDPAVGEQPGTTLGTVMRAFKSISAIACNRLLGRANQPFWQRGFHEHVIRSDIALEKIRRYIDANPANWAMDPDNPNGQTPRAGQNVG